MIIGRALTGRVLPLLEERRPPITVMPSSRSRSSRQAGSSQARTAMPYSSASMSVTSKMSARRPVQMGRREASIRSASGAPGAVVDGVDHRGLAAG
jgi:hypothetical protein